MKVNNIFLYHVFSYVSNTFTWSWSFSMMFNHPATVLSDGADQWFF